MGVNSAFHHSPDGRIFLSAHFTRMNACAWLKTQVFVCAAQSSLVLVVMSLLGIDERTLTSFFSTPPAPILTYPSPSGQSRISPAAPLRGESGRLACWTSNTSGGTLCISGSHTFVLMSWMCKKMTSVSHISTESEISSLDAGLRMDGISALHLWDLVTEVLHSSSNQIQRNQERVRRDPLLKKPSGKHTDAEIKTQFRRNFLSYPVSVMSPQT